MLIITRLGDSLGQWSLPLAVFAGRITSALAVICGLAISFLFGAFTHYLVFSGDQRAAGALLFWTLGGLGLARWDNLPFALLPLVMLFGLLGLRWRSLDALLAGETVALSLGVAVIRLRMEIFLVCALATSLLVALTGVIGFVGLMIPHLARPLCGIRHRRVLPLCALLGGRLAVRRRSAQPAADSAPGAAHRHYHRRSEGLFRAEPIIARVSTRLTRTQNRRAQLKPRAVWSKKVLHINIKTTIII